MLEEPEELQSVVVVSPVKGPIADNRRKTDSPSGEIEESQAFLTSSLSNLPERTDKEEKKSNAFLNLFSRKHAPLSLESIPLKSTTKSKNDSATTPTSSLGFLHKLSFHSKHSPSTPQSPPIHEALSDQPTVMLFPVQEINTPEAEATPTARSLSLVASSVSSPETADEKWFETATRESEHATPSNELTPTTTRRRPDRGVAMSDVFGDETVSLDNLLEDFRSGRMCSLSNSQLGALREMHCQQAELSEVHMALHRKQMQFTDPFHDEMDSQYADIAERLDHLHVLMDHFSSMVSEGF
jgi:hypothetical protein